MRRDKEGRWLFGILGLGLLIRGLHFWAIMGPAFPKIPTVWWSISASQLEGDYRVEWAKQLLASAKREEARQQMEQAVAAYAGHLDLSYPSYDAALLSLELD